jgi:hypothetical protein
MLILKIIFKNKKIYIILMYFNTKKHFNLKNNHNYNSKQ